MLNEVRGDSPNKRYRLKLAVIIVTIDRAVKQVLRTRAVNSRDRRIGYTKEKRSLSETALISSVYQVGSAAVVLGRASIHELLEQRQHGSVCVNKAFRMPLHANCKLRTDVLDRLDHAFGREGRGHETGSDVAHRLMMEAVDVSQLTKYASEVGVLHHLDVVRDVIARLLREILVTQRVRHEVAHVLHQCAAG